MISLTLDTDTVDLQVCLGRLTLPNPIMVASGTFGYAREMEQIVDLSRLGGIVPKTITSQMRKGNAPWRTIETSSGLLNSIGLDNDGLDAFIESHLPYLVALDAPVIVSIAGENQADYVGIAQRLDACGGVAALELNISCPNVAHGVDFGSNPELCEKVVRDVRENCALPVLTKLTPNVTNIVELAAAAAAGGTDAVCLTNTLLGMAVDWRKQRPLLGNNVGGLSGPAIKPVSLRCVYQVAQAVDIPIIGIGGIANLNDCMEFFVAGASAIQIGTANYYDPTVTMRILDELPTAVTELGTNKFSDVPGSVKPN
ncbi:MAG: dihydroorotate dehydrogenase [Planctomycetaceae bacterium]|nr:dihydroorotate dehydrogenase [Planctomycetaceae bacterium]MBT5600583.1 dihydroorotate dehydrogenase [Planctomycetaceae bacterium]MBT7919108.1 dihydroorotate dehydrogenase [Planctomycetaceae bacterium]